MSVVAWDGKTLAADRQCTAGEMRYEGTKIFRIDDQQGVLLQAMAFTGELAGGLDLMRWYRSGALAAEWPEFQKTEQWTRMIVAGSDGVLVYEQHRTPIPVNAPFAAWGSGRDYAMGAMAMGATARQAVEVANRFNIHCGFGVDAIDL